MEILLHILGKILPVITIFFFFTLAEKDLGYICYRLSIQIFQNFHSL